MARACQSVTVVGILMILLGLAVYSAAQYSAGGCDLVRDDLPTFAESVVVPFRQTYVPEYFSVNASLSAGSLYVVDFASSDLYVDFINVTGPDGETTTMGAGEFSFNTTSQGAYTLSMRGYYTSSSGVRDSASIPAPPGTPAREWHTAPDNGSYGGHTPNVDDTLDMRVFQLIAKAGSTYSDGPLYYAYLILLIGGVILALGGFVIRLNRK